MVPHRHELRKKEAGQDVAGPFTSQTAMNIETQAGRCNSGKYKQKEEAPLAF